MPRKRTVDEWIGRIQPNVDYCINCQARDNGKTYWVLGQQQSMADLLNDFRVPESLHEEVARGLKCNNCGTELDVDFDIGTTSQQERTAEREWGRWHAKYQRELKPSLQDFAMHLARVPYLGNLHRIGRQIVREMGRLPQRRLSNVSLWRARAPEGTVTFTSKDMGPPPPSEREGRYNHHGQSVLYLAEEAETAAREIVAGGGIVWVQRWDFVDLFPILDLAAHTDYPNVPDSILEFAFDHDDVLQRVPTDSPWKPEYFVPRYVADVAKTKGFTGIRFKSVRSSGTNVVLFDPNCVEQGMAVGEPKVIELRKPPESDF